jgi:hypothetical protein
VKGTEAVRSALSAATRAAIARHVEGIASFEPGEYSLEPPRDTPDEPEAMLVKLTRAEIEGAT